VAQPEGEMAGTKNMPHAAPTALTDRCTHNIIVPCEKWQLGHCVALENSDLMPLNI